MKLPRALEYRYARAPLTPGLSYQLDPLFRIYRWVQKRRYLRMEPAKQLIEDVIPLMYALCEVQLVVRQLYLETVTVCKEKRSPISHDDIL